MYLHECIESVLAQEYSNFEVIFWDNQSTDNSAQIVRSFNDRRIKYFLALEHTALGLARNLAAAKASGEWIAFLDADDIWTKNKLKLQVELIKLSSSNLALVYSKADIVSYVGINDVMVDFYSRVINKIVEHPEMNIFERLLEGNYIIFSSLLVKKESFENVGGINPNLEQNEDYDLLLKISICNTAVCCGDSLLSYRIHSSNTSINNGLKNFEENNEIFSFFSNMPSVKRAIRMNKTKHALFLFLNKKYKKGMEVFFHGGSVFFALKLICNKLFP
jgi:glycosyltransferase involved in cell wall biosynthesis